LREFRRDSITNVGGERCDAALARKMIAEKGYLLNVGGYFYALVCDQLSRFLPDRDDSLCVRNI
jgi:hypothetical protein